MPSDLRGLARLTTDAAVGVTAITEGVHRSVLSTIGLGGSHPQRAGGLTGLVYRAVRGITRGVGWGFDAGFGALEPLLREAADSHRVDSAQRLAVLAALNGVLGDRLAADRSPFATQMSLRQRGTGVALDRPLQIPAPSGRILLMVHGLCMNDLQWQGRDEDGRLHNHGAAVASALDMTDLYLRYNSGRHIWQNGAALSDLLEQLIRDWPVPVEELSVLAHSMGGLVMRSAVHQAQLRQRVWPRTLKQVVFLATPHHGAPLERAGHGVDLILGATPWTAPFTRLAAIRSAGITDLRYGRIIEDDPLAGFTRAIEPHLPQPLPLPEGIVWRTIAATIAAPRGTLAERLVGDGLVPLDSALGRHAEARRSLAFADESIWISPRTGHLALLNRPAVAERIIGWLGRPLACAHIGSGDGPPQ